MKSASLVQKVNKCFDVIQNGGRELRLQNMEVRIFRLKSIVISTSNQLVKGSLINLRSSKRGNSFGPRNKNNKALWNCHNFLKWSWCVSFWILLDYKISEKLRNSKNPTVKIEHNFILLKANLIYKRWWWHTSDKWRSPLLSSISGWIDLSNDESTVPQKISSRGFHR